MCCKLKQTVGDAFFTFKPMVESYFIFIMLDAMSLNAQLPVVYILNDNKARPAI